jgi:asparagine synthase (glutamine-hydrolysing)
MVEAVRHEPSYERGTWGDTRQGVYVGWTAQRGSFAAAMPIRNETGDVVLVFSGEEYPEPQTANRLRERGHELESDGPSYLVHMYEEDSSFPAGLNGRFQGIIADQIRQTVTLFTDRYGLHRLYYHEADEGFYFAVEAKAILAVRPELRSLDSQALGEFVACGCVLGSRTLFGGIRILPPAAAWVFRHGSIERKGAYFESREWEEQTVLPPERYYQDVREIFSRNLPRYFNGQNRLGFSLTGGLDTRMILAWLKPPPMSLPCYTFGSMFHDCRDVTVARQVAQACGQKHEVIPVGGEFLKHFPHYAERTVYLTDGSTTVSHAPDLYVNERAAQIAPVRVTGNYGDEVLRRMRVFKPIQPTLGLFSPDLLPHVDAANSRYESLTAGHPLTFAVFHQLPRHHYGLLSLEQTQVSMRTPYLDNEFVRKVFCAPEAAYRSNDLRVRLIGDGSPALKAIPTDLGFGGSSRGFVGNAARRFHQFTMKAEYACDYGMPQWAVRFDHMFSPLHFERFFLGRHKFYHFRVWYRDALSAYVRQMLLDSRARSRPYLESRQLESIVHQHLNGKRNHTMAIHRALTLELVHRLFLDTR